MKITKELYRHSLGLLTDFYELTMAYAYWKNGLAERECVFNLFYRSNPFQGGYVVAAGLAYVIDFLENYHFTWEDISFLAKQNSRSGEALFEKDFLDFLASMKFSCDVDAIPEGTVVFPHEPLIRVRGPIVQCQLLETALLNMINFQSLIATKSARICLAAGNEQVLEFGLRRAQGIDGGLAASRASFIGGCSSTSNTLAGKIFDIPVAGTHAHSWIMTFGNELEAFEAYARALPDDCIFLVDTYDTVQGVKKAIKAGNMLRQQGKVMVGIRIDSGDLAYFGQQARKLLDESGFNDALIVASNNLDENLIQSLHNQDSKITTWGVGTKLATAYDEPALGGVYKLSALKDDKGKWEYKIKLSEQNIKINTPGYQQVRRYYDGNKMLADMIYDEYMGINDKNTIYHPEDYTKRKLLDEHTLKYSDLLIPVFRKGNKKYDSPPLREIREKVKEDLSKLHKGTKRFENPHTYHVGLEEKLHKTKMKLIEELRKYQTD